MIKIKKYQIDDYISDSTQSSLNLKADLVGGKVPSSQLPSYVDDVIEVNNYAALPNPGATGVIYITIDNNKVYRWSGTAYIEILSGSTNLSYTPGVSNGTVNSDTGNDAVIPLADTLNAGLFSATEKSKLAGIATGAEVNVNADWNSVSGDSQILNKPTIPSISGLATVTYVDTQDALKVDKVTGKGLSTEDYTTVEKSKLAGIAEGAEVNVNADWNATSGDAQILNKPTIPSISGLATVTYVDTQDFLKVDKVTGSRLITSAESITLGNTSGTNTGDQNLQSVTNSGASTTNSITANSFVKSGGTSSQILVADGDTITAGTNITITGGVISSVGGTGGGGSSVNYYLNGGTSQGTFGGTTYYEFSKAAVIGTGADFSRGTNGYIASFITDVADPSLLLIPAGNWNLEFFFSSSSNGGTPSFYVELYKYDGTTFTLITSNSTNPERITNGTAIDAYFTPLAVPETILTVNDRLAIRVFVNTSGRTITLHTQNGHLCEVITTFTAGLTALNGLQAQVQNFATGTTGTDFAINSSGSTHTFNLPSASATARGVVTTASQTFAGDKTFVGAIDASNLSNTNTGDNATNTQYSGLAASKQDKSLSSYKFIANNTNATANGTEQVFKEIAEQSLSGTGIIATGGTVPSGTQTHSYRWSQVGNLVTIRINLQFGTAGTCSGIAIPFANMPDIPQIPQHPSIYATALDVIIHGSGNMNNAKTFPIFSPAGVGTSAIRIKTIGTPNTYEFCIGRASSLYTNAWAHIQYYI